MKSAALKYPSFLVTQVLSILESLLFFHFSSGFKHARADSSFIAGPDFEHIRTNFFSLFGSGFDHIRSNLLYFSEVHVLSMFESLPSLFLETFYLFS